MYSDMYSSHYNIIKFIGFESINYALNLSAVSSFMIFNDLVSMFVSMNC